MEYSINARVSNRHVHLTKEMYDLLFDEEITKKYDLNQIGEFASNQTLTIKNGDKEINNVRVLGPFREYNQIEISKRDARTLGVNPPVKASGDLKDACDITIIGPYGEITRKACIIANRHIHVDNEIINKYNLQGISEVKVKVDGIKGGILENVYLKETKKAYFEIHLDTDDANAFLIKQNDEVEIIPLE